MRFNFYRSFHNIQFEIRVYFRHSKVTVVSVTVSGCLLCVPLSGQSRADCHRETKNNLDSYLPDLVYFLRQLFFNAHKFTVSRFGIFLSACNIF